MRAVLVEAFEKAATVGTLVGRVGVDGLFKQLDDTQPLPLGPEFAEPAVVHRQPSTSMAASGLIALKPFRVRILNFCVSVSKSASSSVSTGVNVAS